MNKLPQITVVFWITKICATTLGETAGIPLSMTLGIGSAAVSPFILFGILSVLINVSMFRNVPAGESTISAQQ
jgi:uncharacterized membrane-anchored protein